MPSLLKSPRNQRQITRTYSMETRQKKKSDPIQSSFNKRNQLNNHRNHKHSKKRSSDPMKQHRSHNNSNTSHNPSNEDHKDNHYNLSINNIQNHNNNNNKDNNNHHHDHNHNHTNDDDSHKHSNSLWRWAEPLFSKGRRKHKQRSPTGWDKDIKVLNELQILKRMKRRIIGAIEKVEKENKPEKSMGAFKKQLKAIWDFEYKELKYRLKAIETKSNALKHKEDVLVSLKQLSSMHSDDDYEMKEMAMFILQNYFDKNTVPTSPSNHPNNNNANNTIHFSSGGISEAFRNLENEDDSNSNTINKVTLKVLPQVSDKESSYAIQRNNDISLIPYGSTTVPIKEIEDIKTGDSESENNTSNNNNSTTNNDINNVIPLMKQGSISELQREISELSDYGINQKQIESNENNDTIDQNNINTDNDDINDNINTTNNNEINVTIETQESKDDEKAHAPTQPTQPTQPQPTTVQLSNKMIKSLQTVGTWEFDPFEFLENPEVNGRCLVIGTWHVLERTNLLKLFNFSPQKFVNWLQDVENGYLDNPYHNKIHATDVTSNIAYFLCNSEFFQNHLSPIDRFGAIISAAVHDLGHDGNNNSFHVNSLSNLAIQYNDESVLENYHISYAFRLLQKPENNWFSSLPRSIQRYLRQAMIAMVLATDMRHHNTIVSQLTELVAALKTDIATRESHISGQTRDSGASTRSDASSLFLYPNQNNQPSKAAGPMMTPPNIQVAGTGTTSIDAVSDIGDTPPYQPTGPISNKIESYQILPRNIASLPLKKARAIVNRENDMADYLMTITGEEIVDEGIKCRVSSVDDERQFSLQLLVHLCDISNPAKDIKSGKDWAKRIMTEFFKQGDREKQLGLFVSPMMDRNRSSVTQGQIGFIKFVVLPIYEEFAQLVTEANPMLEIISYNLKYWEKEHEKLSKNQPRPRRAMSDAQLLTNSTNIIQKMNNTNTNTNTNTTNNNTNNENSAIHDDSSDENDDLNTNINENENIKNRNTLNIDYDINNDTPNNRPRKVSFNLESPGETRTPILIDHSHTQSTPPPNQNIDTMDELLNGKSNNTGSLDVNYNYPRILMDTHSSGSFGSSTSGGTGLGNSLGSNNGSFLRLARLSMHSQAESIQSNMSTKTVPTKYRSNDNNNHDRRISFDSTFSNDYEKKRAQSIHVSIPTSEKQIKGQPQPYYQHLESLQEMHENFKAQKALRNSNNNNKINNSDDQNNSENGNGNNGKLEQSLGDDLFNDDNNHVNVVSPSIASLVAGVHIDNNMGSHISTNVKSDTV